MLPLPKIINTRLALVESVIRQVVIDGTPSPLDHLRSTIYNSGKRIRPLVFLLSAEAAGLSPLDRVEDIAAAFELIHTASLIHDDIIDEAEKRRSLPSAWKQWGIKTAVLLGDLVWSKATKLLIDNASPDIMRIISASCAEMIEGELKQLILAGKAEVSQADYIEIVTKKTAALFSAAATTGAMLGQKKMYAKSFGQYGLNLGIAFQIIDDLNDCSGLSIGKPTSNDFKQGRITLPLLIALDQVSYEDRCRFEKAWYRKEPECIHIASALIEETNAIKVALSKAKFYRNLAKEAISNLPPSEALFALIWLADDVIEKFESRQAMIG